MWICPNCKNRNREEGLFCTCCGLKRPAGEHGADEGKFPYSTGFSSAGDPGPAGPSGYSGKEKVRYDPFYIAVVLILTAAYYLTAEDLEGFWLWLPAAGIPLCFIRSNFLNFLGSVFVGVAPMYLTAWAAYMVRPAESGMHDLFLVLPAIVLIFLGFGLGYRIIDRSGRNR